MKKGGNEFETKKGRILWGVWELGKGREKWWDDIIISRKKELIILKNNLEKKKTKLFLWLLTNMILDNEWLRSKRK